MYFFSLPLTEFLGQFFLSDLRNPLTRMDYCVTELFQLLPQSRPVQLAVPLKQLPKEVQGICESTVEDQPLGSSIGEYTSRNLLFP